MYLLMNKDDILTICDCLFLSVKGLEALPPSNQRVA